MRYAAQPIEIGFNARYLLDIAEQIEGEGARSRMADAASPTVVRDTRRRQRALRAHADARVSEAATALAADEAQSHMNAA